MSKKISKTRNQVVPNNTGIEYRAWLAAVPEPKRVEIAEKLSEYKLETYQDMGGFIQHLMVEVLRGNITPAVSQELRHWAELLFTVLTVEHAAQGRPEEATGSVIAALLAVARQPIPQATYTQQEREILTVTPPSDPQVLDVSGI